MKNRTLLLLLFIAGYSNAQVPGYMGKRFSIGYSNYFLPTGLGPPANASTPDQFSSFGVNTTHCFNVEYAIKSRTTFCLSFQKAKTGMLPGELVFEQYNGYNSYEQYTVTYDPKPYKPMQISATNISLGFKFFQPGALAPVGKYKKLELLILLNHLTYKKDGFSYYDSYSYGGSSYGGYNTVKMGTGDYRFNTFAIAYTLGRSRVLFDRVVLDCGIRFGLTPAGVWGYLNQNGEFFDSSSTSGTVAYLNNFKYHTNMRMFRCQLFNFHIGLSFLAF